MDSYLFQKQQEIADNDLLLWIQWLVAQKWSMRKNKYFENIDKTFKLLFTQCMWKTIWWSSEHVYPWKRTGYKIHATEPKWKHSSTSFRFLWYQLLMNQIRKDCMGLFLELEWPSTKKQLSNAELETTGEFQRKVKCVEFVFY